MFYLITNIPCDLKTIDLRNYFYDFIEKQAFECFHYRHRPENLFWKELEKLKKEENNIKNDETLEKKIEINNGRTFIKDSKPLHWSTGGLESLKSLISSTKLQKESNKSCFEHLKAGNSNDENKLEDSSSNSVTTTCSILEIKEEFGDNFFHLYHDKHWVNEVGVVLPTKCKITKLSDIIPSSE